VLTGMAHLRDKREDGCEEPIVARHSARDASAVFMPPWRVFDSPVEDVHVRSPTLRCKYCAGAARKHGSTSVQARLAQLFFRGTAIAGTRYKNGISQLRLAVKTRFIYINAIDAASSIGGFSLSP